jgi:carbon storage regulator
MLVLSRQTGERVIIDGKIEVTVIDIRGDRVKLGIVAPPEVAVHREEVFRRIVTSAVAVPSLTNESPYLPEFA